MTVIEKLLLLFFILRGVLKVHSDITPLKPLTGTVGGSVEFLWSTTTGTEIQRVQWGLYRKLNKDVSPVFISVDSINFPNGQLSNDLNTIAVRYKSRVQFIGNISLGRAWFNLTNLELNDTGEYIGLIKEPTDAIDVIYLVNLTVSEPMTTALPTTATTVTTAPGSYSSTTESPTGTKDDLSAGAIAGIVIGVIAVVGICVVIVFCVVKKNKNGRGIL